MDKENVAFADTVDMFASCQEIVEREAPDKFVLLKFGPNKYQRDGVVGVFEFTPEIAQQIIDDHQERDRNLVVDFEHGTMNPHAASQGDSPAAGWIEGFEICDDGLVALVKNWTDKGRDRLQNGEVRYSSPVLRFADKEKTIPCAIQSVALTNHPAIYGNEALVAANDFSNSKEEPMDKNETLQAGMTVVKTYKEGIDEMKDGLEQSLNDLTDIAKGDVESEKQVQEFADGLFGEGLEPFADGDEKPSEALTDTEDVSKLLGLSDDTSKEDVATEVKSLVAIKDKMTDFLKLHDKDNLDDVNILFAEKETTMKEEKEGLEQKLALSDATSLVESLMSEPKCKIPESMKDWAIDLAVKDRKKFDEWHDKAPQAFSDPAEPADTMVEQEALPSNADKEVASAFGMSTEELAQDKEMVDGKK